MAAKLPSLTHAIFPPLPNAKLGKKFCPFLFEYLDAFLYCSLYHRSQKETLKAFLTLPTKQTCHMRAGIPLCHQCCEGSLKKERDRDLDGNGVIVSNAAFGGQSGEIVTFWTWDEEASRVWFVFHQVEKCSGNLTNVKSKIWSYIAFITWRVERAEVSTELLSIPNIACNVAFHLVFWSSGHHLDVDAGGRDAFLSCSPRPCWGGSNHSVASPFGHSGWFSQSQDHLVCGCSRESNLNKSPD